MNLHHLEHFLALVETGSFSRASEALHLTQPALSRSIQMLEQELGTRLIDRIGKRNELTPFGIVVAERARRIVSEAVDLKHTAQLLMQGEGGTIRLGLGSAPNAMFAGPLLSYMLREYPRVGVHLSTGSPDAQVAALRERTFDALLVHSRAVASTPRKTASVVSTASIKAATESDDARRKRAGYAAGPKRSISA